MAKFIDLTGKRIGKWLVVSRASKPETQSGSGAWWLCRCVCGTERIVKATNLNSGLSKSCGCTRSSRMSVLGKNRRLKSGEAQRNMVLYEYKKAAKKRGLEWGISDELFDELSQSNCRYCGCKPAKTRSIKGYWGTYTRNGIDRLDNAKGYLPDNVVSCCEICNKAKLMMSVDEFLSHIRQILTNVETHPF